VECDDDSPGEPFLAVKPQHLLGHQRAADRDLGLAAARAAGDDPHEAAHAPAAGVVPGHRVAGRERRQRELSRAGRLALLIGARHVV
jgi:hypothetical protein